MKHLKLIFALLAFWLMEGISAQQSFQLDSIQWNYQKPENFEIKEANYIIDFLGGNDPLLHVFKPEEEHVNHLKVTYLDNQNIQNLTFEIYIFSLVETIKKGYNTDDFSADVQMERKKINNQVYYLIRSQILHKESNYQYVSDVYLAEINGKEFIVTINYDNDEDKMMLEESFFNSYFL